MVEETKLSVEIRKDLSGHITKAIRAEGKIPAVLYGNEIDNIPISIDEKEFKTAISTEHGENVLLKVKAGSKKAVTAMIKEIQVHPLSMKIVHVDLCQISLTEAIEVEVPIEIEGEAEGVKNEGGVLDHIVRAVHVHCLPTAIPDKFVLDVAELKIGDGLKIQDISSVKDVEILGDPETLVVHVVSPTELKEPEEEVLEEAEEGAEPEIVGAKEKAASEEEGTGDSN